ncbi:MAG TPA: tRNA glutamyl-Q(34) synthetase GluQRS [Gammaproteobacteria bacterium]|nr:tRNA glutamyl-Q(34) synthetase GluQRS [Gammaproteobacteria bacterium]HBX26685.1 tRNA glutamyl-Q(34) synthetase GluQRS [Gammaproteobacteria bacterium]
MNVYRGRFAPSATGSLHLGSIFAALLSFLHAKQQNGQWLVRIDDLDEKRCSQSHSDEILHCLSAFGLESDRAVVYQSTRLTDYADALKTLERQNILYSCTCSRKSLPKGPYLGNCTHRLGQGFLKDAAIRISTRKLSTNVYDLLLGPKMTDSPGDFIVKRRDGLFAYQLACAVDEHIDSITDVIRGVDLLESTPMQCFISERLGLVNSNYGHFPILVDSDGVKLSKQTFASPVDWRFPCKTYSKLAELLSLTDTPSDKDPASTWLTFFQSATTPAAICGTAGVAHTLSV